MARQAIETVPLILEPSEKAHLIAEMDQIIAEVAETSRPDYVRHTLRLRAINDRLEAAN